MVPRPSVVSILASRLPAQHPQILNLTFGIGGAFCGSTEATRSLGVGGRYVQQLDNTPSKIQLCKADKFAKFRVNVHILR